MGDLTADRTVTNSNYPIIEVHGRDFLASLSRVI
jgi:hypothetical protein